MSLNLPFTVVCRVLACMDAEERQRVTLVSSEVFGLSPGEMERLLDSGHFARLHRHFLLQKVPLTSLFQDGLSGRVRTYNKLLKRNILIGQRRFSNPSLNFAESTEPAFSYPLDEPSVNYWQAVQTMQRELLKHSLARQLRRHARFHCHQQSTFLFEKCSSSIASASFRFDHQFAKILLKQNLSFSGDDADDSISLTSISSASSVQSKISFFEALSI